jgi:hypothetical protein
MGDAKPEPSGPNGRGWRGRGAAARPGAPAPSRRRKAILLLGIMLALAGAAAALLFFLAPFEAPYFVTIPVTEYTARELPPNPLAEQDSDALLRYFPEGRRKKAFESQQRDRLMEELAGLKGRKDKAVIVHLRAHALARDGEVFLLPANADLDDAATWLPLAEVVRALRSCPAPHKLLLLDVMQPIADPRLGILVNDVAGRVAAALAAPEERGLLVLCACSPGQVSLVSEELGQSVFAYYIGQGLSGHADGYGPDGRRDGRVTVRELAAFVADHVDRWAAKNRNARQTPALFGRGEDFAVAEGTPEKAPRPEEPPSPPSYPAWLKAGWEARDRWWDDEGFRVAPQAFGQMETVLLRAERRWRAGAGDERVHEELTADLKGFEARVQQARAQARPQPQPRPCSLALARPRGAKPDAATADALRALLARQEAAPPPKPEEVEKDTKEFLTKFAGQAPYQELAWAAFAVLADDPVPTRQKVRFVWRLLRSLQPVPRFVETLALERLDGWEVDDWPAESVRRLLSAVREEGQALAGDPRARNGFGEQLRAAAQVRRRGEALLFARDPADHIKAAAVLEDAENRYRDINRQVEAVARGQRLYDEATVLLPGYELYLAARRDLDPRDERDWKTAVRAAADLSGMLPPPEDDLRKSSEALRLSLGALARPFRKPPGEQQGTAADYLEIQALLQSPRPKAGEREALWQAGRALARRLHRETAAPALPEPSDGSAAERERAARRARLSLDLLKLGGVTGLDGLDRDLAEAAGKAEDGAWQAPGLKLRQAWNERLPKQFRAEKDLATADRLGRVLLTPDRTESKNPTAQLRRLEVLAGWKWLGEHYRAEGEALAGQEAYRNFYDEAGKEYQRLAP